MTTRRDIIASSLGLVSAALPGMSALAADYGRGMDGRLMRLPKLDLESHDAFLTTIRVWANTDLAKAARNRATALM